MSENLNLTENKKLKLAIMGTRGIPARYGGFETFAEYLSKILVSRGHDVTVYCRKRFFEKNTFPASYLGVKLKYFPTIMHKYLETPLHSLTSFCDLFVSKYDAVLLCNAANSPFAWICNLRGIPLAINVDGIERKRSKWNALGRMWYLLGEYCSVKFANRVVADAQVIADYYQSEYKTDSEVIAYGAEAVRREPSETLKKFGLEKEKYILYVSRLEPENNALGVIEAYNKLQTDMPLVIVGDAPYAKEYIELLKSTANNKVVFTGYQFAAAYHEFQSNCYLYIQATEVGGTHPALIEAMAYGNCVIANGTEENIEVLGEAGAIYKKNDFAELSAIIADLLQHPEKVVDYRASSKERATRLYNWEVIADKYEALFYKLIS